MDIEPSRPVMAKYLFLDQSAARDSDFSPWLDDHDARVVVSDVYFAEFSGATTNLVERDLVRLRDFRDRLYYAVGISQCLSREMDSRRRTSFGFIIDSTATMGIRQNLDDPRSFAARVTHQGVRQIVTEDRRSNQKVRDIYKWMVKDFENAMKDVRHRAPAGALFRDEELRSAIKLARFYVFRILVDYGWPELGAERFALRDTFIFRNICAELCRCADWAQSMGIDGQDGEKLDNESINVEYVTIGSYFDTFLTKDKRCQRNDENLRRLLAISPNVRKRRRPEDEPMAG